MDAINSLGPIQRNTLPGQVNPLAKHVGGPSFKDTLNGFLGEVNQLQAKAAVSVQRFAAGEITDVHQVMTASEEAKVSFNMMMEIRNKVMDAYQEVMRIRL